MSSKNDFADQRKAPPVGVSFLLSQLGAHAACVFTDLLAAVDLRPYDAGILRLLGSNPGLTQQQLSVMLGMFPSRLVALLDALESRGFVERRNSASDRRSYQLHLTKEGHGALNLVGKLTQKLEDNLLTALDKNQKQQLFQLLNLIVVQQKLTPGVHPAFRQFDPQENLMSSKPIAAAKFVTTLHRDVNKNATGIVVPREVLAALGTSRKPAVKVTLNGYTYRSSVATMGGQFMISLSAEHRKAAALQGTERLEVQVELDTEARTTEIPADLKAALAKASLLALFEKAAPSRRKELVRQVEDAKTSETRERRIAKIVESLVSI